MLSRHIKRLTTLAVTAILSMTGLTAVTPAAHAVDLSGPMPVLDSEEKAFVTLINNYRAQNGIGPLAVSVAITKAAVWMSNDLSLRPANGFEHTDSLGRDPFVRMAAFGYDATAYNTYAGENIAAGKASAADTFNQWRNSPGHNANMLRAEFTTMGIARVNRGNSPYRWYWTNGFGGFVDATVTAPVVLPPLTVPPSRSAFVPLTPTRLLDTRSGDAIAPEGSATLRVLGRGGVPASGVSAVSVTVTLTGAAGPGFVTAYPAGGGRPDSSSLNIGGSGRTVANLVTVPIGPSGDIVLYTSGGGHLLVDIAGYYATVGATASAGRFQPVSPARILDTRGGTGVPPQGTRVVRVAGQAGVPSGGVSAVSVNLTVTGAYGAGFATAYPAADGLPNASNLNLNGPGETVAGAAVVPVDRDGNIAVYVYAGGDVLIDINGYFTNGSAPSSSSGLFVTQMPQRQLDTRGGGTVPSNGTRTVGAPAGAIAVSSNITLTGTADAGFVSAYPAGQGVPTVSSINAMFGNHTVANHAIIPANGGVNFTTSVHTDLLVDYDGYYLPAGV